MSSAALTFQYLREIVKDQINVLQGDGKPQNKQSDPYSKLQKSTVLQESRCFTDQQINDKKCRAILAQLIYLLNQGEQFLETESSPLFFSVTRLFQSTNMELRRMIYLMIKEFRGESSMYIVTSCLVKDISSKNDLCRMNALRTIPLVLDASNLVQIQRYLKNSIIDSNYAVSSAALLAGIQLFPSHTELVKKWSNEIIDRLNSKHAYNHFHALSLLNRIKSSDRNSFIKILSNCAQETFNTLATMQLIRFIQEIMTTQDVDSNTEKIFLDFLNRQIHKSNEATVFEACKTLCELRNISNKDLTGCVSVLSIFLMSSSTINKFAALRILNKLILNPTRRNLISSTTDIESILQDNNKSLSSLAVSVLLKLCKDDNIEKLLNQIYENLNDMSDEFKIDILRSIRSLVKTMPTRFKAILTFLTNCLKSEGNYDFKKYAVELLELMIHEIPQARENSTNALAEYIEDCQYQHLHLQVLGILNREASNRAAPQKVIRFINNRAHLEQSEIRAAAVGTIGKFGMKYPELKDNIISLLRQSTDDPDEEVRERSYYFIGLLTNNDAVTNDLQNTTHVFNLENLDKIEKYVQNNLSSLQNSEDVNILSQENIQQYAEENKGQFAAAAPLQTQNYQEAFEIEEKQEKEAAQAAIVPERLQNTKFEEYKKLFQSHPIFAQYGELLSVSRSNVITDESSEYLVSNTTYFFDEFLVFEFTIKNTLANVILNDVSVQLKFNTENLKVAHIVPAKQIKSGESSNVLIGIAKHPEFSLVSCSVNSILTFQVHELSNSSQYDDEYQLEDFDLNIKDYIEPFNVQKNKFSKEWDRMETQEQLGNYKLNYQNTDIAIKDLVKHFGMAICEGSDQINPGNKYHTLHLAGIFLHNTKVLVTAMIAFDSKLGCLLKIKVKTLDQKLATNLLESLNS